MNRKECRSTRREIEQSELNQRLTDQALAHMESCLPCREFHDERVRLRELVGSLEPVVAPGDFDVRLRARIAAERQRTARRSFFTKFAVGTPAIAVVALLVMVVGAIVWFAQRGGNQPSAVASGPTSAREQTGPVSPPSSTSTGLETASTGTDTSRDLTAAAPRGGDRNPFRTAGGRSMASRGAVGPANDLSLTGAEMIRQGEVSLSAPVKPLVVSMQDDRGTKRKISLPPVSFGSQRLVDNRFPVSSNSRSW